MTEIELKLAAKPEDLAKLKAALLAMAGKPAATSGLTSTYYDTPDRSLRRQDLSLRVRKQGKRFVQTVKAYDVDGPDLTSRGEWEDAIAGLRPDLAAPQSGCRLPPSIRADQLRPLFTTAIRRTAIMLEPRPGTLIEAALDEGEIQAGDGGPGEAICEVELELKNGDPAVLFDIALRLLDVASLRVEMRSKSERGYRLAAGGDPRPNAHHADQIALAPEMTVEATLQSIGQRCLAQLLRNEPAALAELAEGVHQMRVAVRRLRSALSALKPMLPEEHHRWANDELKWLADALGPARNWDVFCTGLLNPVRQALTGERDLERLAHAAEQRRAAAHQRVRQAILSQRYTTAMLKLHRWFAARGWRDQPVTEQSALLLASIGELAPGLIERRYRQAIRRARHFAELPPEQRHQLRIALKKLRYTVEFLQSLFDKDAVAAFVKQLKPLQDDLGHSNDVRITAELLGELCEADGEPGLERAGGIVLGWHDRGVADSEPTLRKHIRRLRRAKPFW